jgi:hypothetical protein
MNERKEISLNNSIMDIMVLMAEGNPGGLSVIASLVKDNPDGIVYLLHLDDMNIRGTQIWIGFKDYCGQSMTKFVECIVSRDQGMIDKINEVNQAQGEAWMATKGQASSGQRLKF